VYFLVRFFAEILYLKTVYENMGVGGKDCFTWNTAPICFWGLIVHVKSGLSLRKFQPGPRCGVRGQRSAQPPPRTMADSPHPRGAYPTGYGIRSERIPYGVWYRAARPTDHEPIPPGVCMGHAPGHRSEGDRTHCPVRDPATRAGRSRATGHGPRAGRRVTGRTTAPRARFC